MDSYTLLYTLNICSTAGTRAGDVESIKKTGKGIRYGCSRAHLEERPEICLHLFSSDPVYILYKLHYSRVELHKIFPEVSPICENCKQADAELLHSHLSCSKVDELWTAIFLLFSMFQQGNIINIRPDPILVISGALDSGSQQTTQRHFLSSVEIDWSSYSGGRKTAISTFKAIVMTLTDTLHLQRIPYILSGRLEEYEKTWKPIISYFKQFFSQDVQPLKSAICETRQKSNQGWLHNRNI